MRSHLNVWREFVKACRQGEFLGDMAGLKTSLFGIPRENPALASRIRPLLSRNRAPVSLHRLLALREGCLGRAYGEFLKRHDLKPFNFSGRYEGWFEQFPIMVRYIRIHDIVHTLLGFDTSLEGELGVYSFVACQNHSSMLHKAYQAARIGYRIIRPWRLKFLRAADERGKRLAAHATLLLAEPFEDCFEEDLAQLRKRLLRMEE